LLFLLLSSFREFPPFFWRLARGLSQEPLAEEKEKEKTYESSCPPPLPFGTRVANLGASLQHVQHIEKPFSSLYAPARTQRLLYMFLQQVQHIEKPFEFALCKVRA